MSVYGVHGLSCHFIKGHHLHHESLNDIIRRFLESDKVPCHHEPSGLFRSDGKRPDGASLVPWKDSKVFVWDMTYSDTLPRS